MRDHADYTVKPHHGDEDYELWDTHGYVSRLATASALELFVLGGEGRRGQRVRRGHRPLAGEHQGPAQGGAGAHHRGAEALSSETLPVPLDAPSGGTPRYVDTPGSPEKWGPRSPALRRR
jgi:hypothetical protein